MRQPITRRSFLKTSALATSAVAMSARSYASVPGANDRVRVGVIGVRGMGFGHVRGYGKLDNVEVAAICDVDETIIRRRVADMERMKIGKPDTYEDLRRMLEDKNIDAVSVATPNHWHALAGYWAVQAGKHATLEKPGTHNIYEGQQLIKASKRYGKMIQHHAERRCFTGFQSAVKFLRDGGLGEVYMAKGLCYKWRDTIGRKLESTPPSGVNYDLWLGPAPERPFTDNRFHYNWHWHWDYGNGDLGNQGAHQMDIARWGLGVDLPTKVSSIGGHFMFDDDQETPNTQTALYEFPNPNGGGDKKKLLQFEVRHWMTNYEGDLGNAPGNNIGNIFYGSDGYMTIDGSGTWKTFMGRKREPGPAGEGGGDMWANFVDAIRADDQSKLEGDIVEGHLSCALIHYANISYRLGRTLDIDIKSQAIRNDREANRMLTCSYRSPFTIPREV